MRVALWMAMPMAFLLLFPSLDFARREGWTASSITLDLSIAEQPDFDAFQQMANGVTFVRVVGPRDGRQLAGAAFFFIPRSIWPDKAAPTGPLVAATVGNLQNLNVAAPLWEEAFVDFGILGVVVILTGLGWFVWGLERSAASSPGGGPTVFRIAQPFLAGYGFFVLRGALLPAVGTLTVAVMLLLACAFLMRRGTHLQMMGVALSDPTNGGRTRTARLG